MLQEASISNKKGYLTHSIYQRILEKRLHKHIKQQNFFPLFIIIITTVS